MFKGKLLLAIALASTIWSCSPQKWCAEHYPPIIKDSIWTVTEIVCVNDTIYLPEITLGIDTTLNDLPPTLVYHSWKKQGNLTAKIDIKNGRIKFLCAEDSLRAIVEIQSKIISRNQSRFKLISCDKEHRTKVDYFYRWFSWITIALILIAVIIKCFRG